MRSSPPDPVRLAALRLPSDSCLRNSYPQPDPPLAARSGRASVLLHLALDACVLEFPESTRAELVLLTTIFLTTSASWVQMRLCNPSCVLLRLRLCPVAADILFVHHLCWFWTGDNLVTF